MTIRGNLVQFIFRTLVADFLMAKMFSSYNLFLQSSLIQFESTEYKYMYYKYGATNVQKKLISYLSFYLCDALVYTHYCIRIRSIDEFWLGFGLFFSLFYSFIFYFYIRSLSLSNSINYFSQLFFVCSGFKIMFSLLFSHSLFRSLR